MIATWREAKEKPKKFLAKINDTIKQNRKLCAEKYKDVGMGEAYYRGDQYGDWDDKSLSWRNEDITDEEEPRLVSNQVKIYTDQAVSKITRYRPAVMTTPESNHETDIRGSKVAEELLQHEMREHNFTDLEERYVKTSTKTGIGWFYAGWNPDLNEEVIEDRGEEGNVSVEVKKIYKGDIEYSLPRPMNMLWDLSAVLWKDVKWCIEEVYIDPDTLVEQYPKHADKIRAQIKKTNSGDSYGEENKVENTLVKCWKFYHKPTNGFPEGCEAFGFETAVLEIGDFPYEHGKLPYTPLVYSTDDECLFGKGVPQTMFETQAEYNELKNIRTVNLAYSAAIKFMNPSGSNYDADAMTNKAGEIIDFDGDQRPGWEQPVSSSAEINETLDRLKAEMQDSSYVGATSQGKPPEGIRSGIAIQYLIENDDLNFAGVIRRKDEAMLDICYQILELMRQYYEDEDGRYYKVIGDNKNYQLKKFKKVNLDGKYDVVIQNSNSNPLSKAYKMDTVLQLVQYGILDQQDRAFIGQSLDMGNLKGVYEDLEADTVRANKEIDDIISGKPHDIMPEFDGHTAHYNAKVRYLKKEYDKLSPQQREGLKQAAMQHQQIMQEQQQAMMAQQQAMQGGQPQQQAQMPEPTEMASVAPQI